MRDLSGGKLLVDAPTSRGAPPLLAKVSADLLLLLVSHLVCCLVQRCIDVRSR